MCVRVHGCNISFGRLGTDPYRLHFILYPSFCISSAEHQASIREREVERETERDRVRFLPREESTTKEVWTVYMMTGSLPSIRSFAIPDYLLLYLLVLSPFFCAYCVRYGGIPLLSHEVFPTCILSLRWR